MSAEVGADLSGMEFSRQYAPSFAEGTVTRGRMLFWATLYGADGEPLVKGDRTNRSIPELLMKGPVYAAMDLADTDEKREFLRRAHPIFFMPLERSGIDPFKEKFPLTLRYEGTMRGTGGLRLTSNDCATTVAGLYAAGDAATREKVTGAISGGGAYNASWAICSGDWAGEGAARYALSQPRKADNRQLVAAGHYGMAAGADSSAKLEVQPLITAIQDQILPLKINYFRNEPGISAALNELNALVPQLKGQAPATVQGIVKSREAAAMLTVGRWMYTAALARTESRGLQKMAEYPLLDPSQTHRLILSGIDHISISTESVPHAHELNALKEGHAV